MPFGLTNTPATFQAYINKALSRLVDYFVVVYLNDILIYSKLGEDHYAYVRIVIERLRKHKLYAKLSKCFFNVEEVEFLGFIMGSIGVKPDPDRILTIEKWPKPKSFYKVQVFLGFANFYRRFIHRYFYEAIGLTNLLVGIENGRKTGPFTFTPKAKASFEKLKKAFTTVRSVNQPPAAFGCPATYIIHALLL
jgi:hypothetical protein